MLTLFFRKPFKPRIEIKIESQRYLVKTATHSREFFSALSLRYQVFGREFKKNLFPFGLDTDSFDRLCDHLIVIEKSTDKVVGTYRLNCSLFNQSFYSSTEFDLSEFELQDGVKLELGRACVHVDHRNGITLALLWKGIKLYAERCGADTIFGCSSIKTNDASSGKDYHDYFSRLDLTSNEFGIFPINSCAALDVVDDEESRPRLSDKEIEATLPPLLRTYLKMGARIHGFPAYDPEFECLDFLTIIAKPCFSPASQKRVLEAC